MRNNSPIEGEHMHIAILIIFEFENSDLFPTLHRNNATNLNHTDIQVQ